MACEQAVRKATERSAELIERFSHRAHHAVDVRVGKAGIERQAHQPLGSGVRYRGLLRRVAELAVQRQVVHWNVVDLSSDAPPVQAGEERTSQGCVTHLNGEEVP